MTRILFLLVWAYVIAAAKMANAGENIQSIMSETRNTISQISMRGFLDTMKYIIRGGRATPGVIDLSSVFHVKPIITFQDGEATVDGLVGTYSDGIDRLCKFVERAPAIQDLGIAYSTNYDRVEEVKTRLESVVTKERIYIQQIRTAFEVHTGPNAILMALR